MMGISLKSLQEIGNLKNDRASSEPLIPQSVAWRSSSGENWETAGLKLLSHA